MPFNVAEFRAGLLEKDLLRNNKFHVRMPIPLGMLKPNMGNDPQTAHDMEFWCEAASIPAIGIQTNKVYRYGYGVVENRAYSKIFTDVNITYQCDGYNDIWRFFENWTNLIFNSNMSQGILAYSEIAGQGMAGGPLGSSGLNLMVPYEIAYRDEYITDINIEVFNQLGDKVTSVVLRDAFPSAVSGLDFNWNDNDSYAKLQVSFAFTDIFRNTIVG